LERLHNGAEDGRWGIKWALGADGYESSYDVVLRRSLSKTVYELRFSATIIALEVLEAPNAVCEIAAEIILIESINYMLSADVDKM
jgi:hypothetical protein